MATSTYILSPELRMVSGDPFKPNTTDKMGNPKTVKNGPNAGQPTQDFPISGAIAKTNPLAMPFLMSLAQVAASAKPALFPQGVKQPPANMPPKTPEELAREFGCAHPKYALKIQDGDGWDGDGKPNSVKEGHAGHWIIKMSQPSQPKVFEKGHYAEVERVDIDPSRHSLLKRGYYIRVNIGAQDNENDQRPGLYLNPSMIEVTRGGLNDEITSGPDANAVFGGGASAPAPAAPTPAAPAGPVATGKDGQTIEGLRANGWTDDQMVAAGYATRPPSVATPPAAPPAPTPPAAPPAPAAVTPSPSSAPAAPYGGYMQTATPPAPPAAPAAPQDTGGAPAGFRMLPAAQGATYQMMLANGWTDDTMKANGMMGPL